MPVVPAVRLSNPCGVARKLWRLTVRSASKSDLAGQGVAESTSGCTPGHRGGLRHVRASNGVEGRGAAAEGREGKGRKRGGARVKA